MSRPGAPPEKLFLVGTCHRDPRGLRRCRILLDHLDPDVVLVEVSPYGVWMRREHRRFFLRLLRRNLAAAAAARGMSLSAALRTPPVGTSSCNAPFPSNCAPPGIGTSLREPLTFAWTEAMRAVFSCRIGRTCSHPKTCTAFSGLPSRRPLRSPRNTAVPGPRSTAPEPATTAFVQRMFPCGNGGNGGSKRRCARPSACFNRHASSTSAGGPMWCRATDGAFPTVSGIWPP